MEELDRVVPVHVVDFLRKDPLGIKVVFQADLFAESVVAERIVVVAKKDDLNFNSSFYKISAFDQIQANKEAELKRGVAS